jgi:hypothetical protein
MLHQLASSTSGEELVIGDGASNAEAKRKPGGACLSRSLL